MVQPWYLGTVGLSVCSPGTMGLSACFPGTMGLSVCSPGTVGLSVCSPGVCGVTPACQTLDQVGDSCGKGWGLWPHGD